MTIGYHINAAARTVEPVNYTSIQDIKAILGCQMIGHGGYVGCGYVGRDLLLVDDNGLWKPATDFWRLVGSFEPVPHDALLVGRDHMDAGGNEAPTDPTITVEGLRALVEWVNRADYEAWIEAHRDQAAVTINDTCVRTWGQVYAEMPKP